MEPIIILGLYYGLRRSEILGLRWKDIDFDNDTIEIKNTIVKQTTIVEQEKTKSRASARTLFIVPETREFLLSLKRKQMENSLLLGLGYHRSDYVCVKADGKRYHPAYVSKRFGELLKKFGLPHIRLHELRHSAASILLRSGLSVKQVQEFMGHEKPNLVLELYAHLTADDKKETARTIGNLLKISAV
jgi:integrase